MGGPEAARLAREGDPIDLQLHRLGAAPARARALPWHVRLGISLSSGFPPVVLLLLIGGAMGPHALALLTPRVLSALDPAIPVALGVLGAHVGLSLPLSRSALGLRLLMGATLESVVTGVIVAAGMLWLLSPDMSAPTVHAWLIALAAGVCASMSAALPEAEAGLTTPATELQTSDVIVPTIVGGLVLAWIREGSMVDAILVLAQATAIALVVALAAWLLLSRATSDTELRIFGVSSLLLVGGLADYLSLSALLSGLVAGTFWRLAGGEAGQSIRRDVVYLRHPLVVLLLVLAGARLGGMTASLAIVGAYVLLRTVGKLFGGWLARRVTHAGLPDDLGLSLLTPGVFGVAFAMNVVRSAGTQSDPLLAIVILGTMGSQLIAALRRPRELPE